MGEVLDLRTDRFDVIDGRGHLLRAACHGEAGVFVVSLWHSDVCVGTVHLSPHDAARVSGFIADRLADLATHARSDSSAMNGDVS
jgi:hypothetical protein